jgi:hypothetical protein
MVFKDKELKEAVAKVMDETTGKFGIKKFSNPDEVMKHIIAEMSGQGHYGWDNKYTTIEEFLLDSPNGEIAKEKGDKDEKLKSEYDARAGSYYASFAMVVLEWSYNIEKKLTTDKNTGWETEAKKTWENFEEIRNYNSNSSAGSYYGTKGNMDGSTDTNLRSWADGKDGKFFDYKITCNEAIKRMKAWGEAKAEETTEPTFDPSAKIAPTKKDIEDRINNYVKDAGMEAKAGIEENINKYGLDEKVFNGTTIKNWQTFLLDAKNKNEQNIKLNWIERNLTRALLDFWLSRAKLETDQIKLKGIWDLTVKYWNDWKNEETRYYYKQNPYDTKLRELEKKAKGELPFDLTTERNKIKAEWDKPISENFSGMDITQFKNALRKSGAEAGEWQDESDYIAKQADRCSNEAEIEHLRDVVNEGIADLYIVMYIDLASKDTNIDAKRQYLKKLTDFQDKYTHYAFQRAFNDTDNNKNIEALRKIVNKSPFIGFPMGAYPMAGMASTFGSGTAYFNSLPRDLKPWEKEPEGEPNVFQQKAKENN